MSYGLALAYHSSNFGTGETPASQRLTWRTETPAISARATCVSFRDLRHARSSSGSKGTPPVILAPAGTIARRADGPGALSPADNLRDVSTVDFGDSTEALAGEAANLGGTGPTGEPQVFSLIEASERLAASLHVASNHRALAISTGLHDCHLSSPRIDRVTIRHHGEGVNMAPAKVKGGTP